MGPDQPRYLNREDFGWFPSDKVSQSRDHLFYIEQVNTHKDNQKIWPPDGTAKHCIGAFLLYWPLRLLDATMSNVRFFSYHWNSVLCVGRVVRRRLSFGVGTITTSVFGPAGWGCNRKMLPPARRNERHHMGVGSSQSFSERWLSERLFRSLQNVRQFVSATFSTCFSLPPVQIKPFKLHGTIF